MRLSDQITILARPEPTDGGAYGDVYDWDDAVRTVEPAEVHPSTNTETVLADQLVVSLSQLIVWDWSVLRSVDRVEWRGNMYEVQGDVETDVHRGRVSNKRALIKLVVRS